MACAVSVVMQAAIAMAAFAAAACILIFFYEAAPAQFRHDVDLGVLHQKWRTASAAFAAQLKHPPEAGSIVHQQAWFYLDVARRKANVVCEAGFYQGMSSHLWLFAHNASTVHSFDVHFPRRSLAALWKSFGRQRLSVYTGSTRKTLPNFRPRAPCDIVAIDASHDGWDPYQDLVDILPSVRCNATVLFDDTFDDRAVSKELDNEPRHSTFYNACTRSYWRAVREGLLEHVSCEGLGKRLRWGKWPKGYCVGRAVGLTSCSGAAGAGGVKRAKRATRKDAPGNVRQTTTYSRRSNPNER